MDFVSDQLTNGRRLKCLTVTDDYSNEAVLIAVDVAMPGQYVTQMLDYALVLVTGGRPVKLIRCSALPSGRPKQTLYGLA